MSSRCCDAISRFAKHYSKSANIKDKITINANSNSPKRVTLLKFASAVCQCGNDDGDEEKHDDDAVQI